MLQASYYQRLAKLQGSRSHERDSFFSRNRSDLVDDRKLEDLLATVRKYAKQTKFINSRFEEEGTWERIFENEDILILSTVTSIDSRQLREQFIHRRTYGYSYALFEVAAILNTYEDWFRMAKSLKTEQAVDVYLNSKTYLKRLSETLVDLVEFIANEKGSSYLNIPVLNALLKPMAVLDANEMASPNRLKSRAEKDRFLLNSVEALVRGLDVLAKDAKRAFHHLLSKDSCEPAVAMLLAFLASYQKSQARINTFPNKLLSFYQKDLLKNHPISGEGDRVYLHCETQLGIGPTIIPKGTEFEAGKSDQLEPLRYQSISDVHLSGARINALHTLCAQRHDDIAPNNVTDSITRIKTLNVLEQTNLSRLDHNIFGYEPSVTHLESNMESDIGFYISSPLLRLKEGQREISLNLQLKDKAILALETARGRFQALSESGNMVKTKEALYQLDVSNAEFMSQLRQLDFSVDRLSLVLALYSCLGNRTISRPEILSGLLKYVPSNGTKKLLVGWARQGDFDQYELLKDCLLYLYQYVKDVQDLGAVHFELLTRQMMRPNFLNENDRMSMENVLKNIGEVSDRDEMKREDMIHDSHRTSEASLVHYLQDAFECRISHESGWLTHRNYRIQHHANNKSDAGFILTLLLENEIPPIVDATPKVHGPQPMADAPVFILRVNKHVPVCPISWFENFWVEYGKLGVSVCGLRDVVVHNEYGQADTSKPFMPFSSIPKYDSRFYIGGFEFASKNVDQLSVKLTWKNLPKLYGGLGAYYAEFGKGMQNSDFKVNLTLLAHGSLIPSQVELQQVEPLFDWHPTSNKLSDTSVFHYQFTHEFPKLNRIVSKDEYNNLANTDHGYLCVRLRSSEKAFGHQSYPRLLGEILAFNAKFKRKNRTPPNSPYTPEISRVEVNYRATEDIEFATDFSALTLRSKSDIPRSENSTIAFHQWPLGLGLPKSKKGQRLNPLFPVPNEAGNLYVGFALPQPVDRLCLYFELNQTSLSGSVSGLEPVQWRYYAQSGWKFLAKEDVIADTTGNLSRSGIVTFSLPADACTHPGFKPDNQFWLCVSHKEPQYFGALKALSFDALELSSVNGRLTLSNVKTGTSSQWSAVTDIPGLVGLSQTEISFESDMSESNDSATIRMLERLRHKNRAVTPWDYERIVLNEYADVALVKCLPNCRMHQQSFKAGEILIVLMATATEQGMQASRKPHLDGLVLRDIQQRLNAIAPATATINVVNAMYEQIQVRCAVEFSSTDFSGDAYRQLQQDLSYYFSPWSDIGPAARFSWTYRPNDIEAFISSRSYVSRVARVSLVKCYSDKVWPEYFRLEDTAAQTKDDSMEDRLVASTPWSLPLSSRHHQIDILPRKNQDFEPRTAGINTLEIGNTFVIRGSESHA